MPLPLLRQLHSLRILARQSGAEGFYVFGAVLVLIIMVWVFAELAENVHEGETQRIDEAILHFFRHQDQPSVPVGPPWLPQVMRDITALGGHAVLTLATLIAVGFCTVIKRLGPALFVLAASIGATALNSLLKGLFERARPDTLLHLTEVSTTSFPSGHSALSAAIYLSLAVIVAQLTTHHAARLYILGSALLLTGLVGASRIYLGVHYPSDVLAGWVIGLAWAISCWLAMQALQRLRR